MRPSHLVHGLGIVQLDVQVLIDALERSADLDFVFEFDRNFVLDERLEETAVRMLAIGCCPIRLRDRWVGLNEVWRSMGGE
jgi:hypothetical protein